MNRYLINIAYIGTRFRGIQKHVINGEPKLDTSTVQGSLELALRVFRPVNPIETHLSSRTDAGVHALQSTVHVDLERNSGAPYEENVLTGVLNRTLDKHDLPIRVINTIRVPSTFHCRYQAKGRTYLYRIAVAKDGPPGDVSNNRNYENFIPVEEIKRCYFIQDHRFCITKFKDAANLFLGKHDFRSFMSSMKEEKGPMFTIRSISDINIYPTKSVAVHFHADRASELYNYWNVEISARSFIYKQVRRIIGSLVAVACDRISKKDIYEMLTVPSKHTWNPRIRLAPPFGLYLCKVHYDKADFILSEASHKIESTSSDHESSIATPIEKRKAQAN